MFLPGFYFRYSLNKLRANCFFLNSDEEKLMVASAKSAHNVGSFKALQLKHNLSTYETVQLINWSSVKPYVIKSKLLLDIIGTVALVSIVNPLKIALIVTYKTQTSSTANISDEASYSVCERLEEHRIVKRYYKCPDNHEF